MCASDKVALKNKDIKSKLSNVKKTIRPVTVGVNGNIGRVAVNQGSLGSLLHRE